MDCSYKLFDEGHHQGQLDLDDFNPNLDLELHSPSQYLTTNSIMTGEPVNPLFYPPVFLEISKFLSLADLKNCRLVCEEWETLSFTALRMRSIINLNSPITVQRFNSEAHGLHGLGNFKLNLNRGDTPLLGNVIFYIGNGIRELNIDCYHVMDPLVKFIGSNSNTLESISIKFSTYNGTSVPNSRLSLPIETFYFPNLVKVNVNQIPVSDSAYFPTILNSAPNLTHINCTDRNLSGWIWNRLDNWKGTLKTLRIGYVNFVNLKEDKKYFPLLSKLKKLELMYWQVLNGIENLPQLEELVVQRSNLEGMFTTQMGPLKNVRQIKIEDVYRLGNSLKCLSTLYPNLRVLNFPAICNRSLRIVFASLSNIEELYIGSAIVDVGIIGYLSNKYFPEIIESVQEAILKRDLNLFYLNPKNQRKYPYIGDLKKLTHITICSRKITDLTVILGLIHCPTLTSIRIERPVISKQCLISLADFLRLQHLHVRLLSRFTYDWTGSQELFYFQRQSPNCNLQILVHPNNSRHLPFRLSLNTESQLEQ